MTRIRAKQLPVRLTEAELKAVKKKIEKSDLTQQNYLRDAVMQKDIIETKPIGDLHLDLIRTRNTINEITQRGLANDPAILEAVQETTEQLRAVWRLLSDIYGQLK